MRFLLCLFIGIGFPIWSQPVVLDKVVSQIGDNVILLSDIETQKLQAKDSKVEIDSAFDCQVLENLMIEQIFVNQAKLDSIIIADEQVDADMENRLRLLQQQLGGRQKLEEFYGMSFNEIKDKFRETIRERMMADEMRLTITRGISVTPKEVADFYVNIPKDSIPFINMQLGFQQIVLYPEITKADKKAAYDNLAKIRTDIVSLGKSFESMARLYSMDPGSAPMGGKIAATKGMMVSNFEATLFKLKVGEVSEVIETEFGYHIIKLISRSGEDYVCLHILIRPEFSTQSINKSSQRMDSCYRMLKMNEITWDQAVLKYSNDINTKQNKGIITNPITGAQTWDMKDLNEVDQQIYLLTDAMRPGDVTQPSLYTDLYERKQGIRIVRLMNRIPAHVANLNEDYALVKSAAENDKKQKMLDEWVFSKLGNAYIRIDNDYQNCAFRINWNKKENE
ncbi:MAG: peptidylprolyl isomerase [Flavobacteriia bacterium]|jgi:peptidyl-prolyl cis-trans isomerase SurA